MKYFTATLIFLVCLTSHAYRSTGFEQINTDQTLKKAAKLGLIIANQERQVKKELLRLKKSDPQTFKAKVADKLANPEFYQSYLLEIEEGLGKLEKAKTIAKYVLYDKFEKNWKDLKLTSVNTIAEKDFAKYKSRLINDLQGLVFVKNDKGYKFEVAQWGYVTVSTNLAAVTWRIEFASKNDKNILEPGAEDITIAPSNGGSEDVPPSMDDDNPNF